MMWQMNQGIDRGIVRNGRKEVGMQSGREYCGEDDNGRKSCNTTPSLGLKTTWLH